MPQRTACPAGQGEATPGPGPSAAPAGRWSKLSPCRRPRAARAWGAARAARTVTATEHGRRRPAPDAAGRGGVASQPARGRTGRHHARRRRRRRRASGRSRTAAAGSPAVGAAEPRRTVTRDRLRPAATDGMLRLARVTDQRASDGSGTEPDTGRNRGPGDGLCEPGVGGRRAEPGDPVVAGRLMRPYLSDCVLAGPWQDPGTQAGWGWLSCWLPSMARDARPPAPPPFRDR